MLWEGNLVKAHLVLHREEKTPLHKGAVECVFLEDDMIVTAATDGYIKWWSLAEIDAAECDEILEVAIAPIKEITVKTEAGEYA